jgi:hypothetical protein
MLRRGQCIPAPITAKVLQLEDRLDVCEIDMRFFFSLVLMAVVAECSLALLWDTGSFERGDSDLLFL